MKFVRGKGKKIDCCVAQADRDFPDGLHCVGVKEQIFLTTYFSDFLDWKQHTGLVVRPHHRNEHGFRSNRVLQFSNIDIALSIDAKKGHETAASLKILARSKNSAVFHGRRDDTSAMADSAGGEFSTSFRLSSLRSRYGGVGQRRMNHGIIGFSAAAGKNNFRRIASE